MIQIKEQDLESIIKEVMKRLEAESPVNAATSAPVLVPQGQSVIYPSIDQAVRSAKAAQILFQEMGLDLRKKIIAAIRKAGEEHAQELAQDAAQETGLGRWQDKVKKNILVSLKTPGVEDLQPATAYTGDSGLTLVEQAPFGVVASITPSTNPTATIINNAISILSAGNSVVFAPHPAAKNCCHKSMRILHSAIVSAGGPKDLITGFENNSQEDVLALLRHPEINLVLVTGGPGIVKAAMQIGIPRKTICAGPGNPPVIVDETADFSFAAKSIVDGASFDNNVLCTAEKEVILTQSAAAPFLAELRKDPRAYELTLSQMNDLARLAFPLDAAASKPGLNRAFVGKDANVIARALQLSLPDSLRLLWGEVPNDHPFVWTEQLMPVLPVTRAPDIAAAVELAKKVEGNNHHTAAIYSMHVANITLAARTLACSIFVKNGPTYMGLGMGEGFATMSIGTPTGDGLTKPTHFSRPLHCSMVGYLRIV